MFGEALGKKIDKANDLDLTLLADCSVISERTSQLNF
jgi:hypothetical protein